MATFYCLRSTHEKHKTPAWQLKQKFRILHSNIFWFMECNTLWNGLTHFSKLLNKYTSGLRFFFHRMSRKDWYVRSWIAQEFKHWHEKVELNSVPRFRWMSEKKMTTFNRISHFIAIALFPLLLQGSLNTDSFCVGLEFYQFTNKYL